MSSTQPTTTPNAELIDGLRELADFLDQHPELPAFRGSVGHNAYSKNAREQMTAMARALGSRAIERPDSLLSERVEILAEFGTLVLRMSASVRDLGGSSVPAHLSYAPILAGVVSAGDRCDLQLVKVLHPRRPYPGQTVELYRRGDEFFYVSTVPGYRRGEETVAFACDEDGNVTDWGGVAVATGADSREEVLRQLRGDR